MPRYARLIASALTAALFCAASAQAAPIIAGDPFTLKVEYDDNGTPTTAGPANGSASASAGNNAELDPDVGVEVLPDIHARVRWIDNDTFELFFGGPPATEFSNLSLVLEGLDFSDAGQAAPIIGAAFNPNGGNWLTFDIVKDGFMSPPAVTFTPNSVRMTFGSFLGGFTADGPRMQVDVRAAVAAVPAPAAWTLLLAGFAAFGATSSGRRLTGLRRWLGTA